MAWAHVGSVGLASSKAGNQSSIAVNVDTSAAIDDVLIVVTAKDNINTTFADHSEITSITDTGSNSYVKAHERTGSMNTKQISNCSVWSSKLTTALAVNDTITINFASSNSNDASAAIVEKFTIGSGNVVSVIDTAEADTDGADPASLTSGTLANAEHLAIYGLGWERPGTDDFTADGGFAEFSTGDIGTTGGGAASNQAVFAEWDIFTGTTITADPSEAGGETADHVSLLVIYDEGATPTANPPAVHHQRYHNRAL